MIQISSTASRVSGGAKLATPCLLCRRMHAEEQRLQEALVREVGYVSSAGEVQDVMRAAAARPNVDGAQVRDAVYVVLAAAEAAR